VHGILNLCIW